MWHNVIATHSPILMTFPGATIYTLDGGKIRKVSLAETQHYQITRGILEAPERYWRHLKGWLFIKIGHAQKSIVTGRIAI